MSLEAIQESYHISRLKRYRVCSRRSEEAARDGVRRAGVPPAAVGAGRLARVARRAAVLARPRQELRAAAQGLGQAVYGRRVSSL